MALTLVETIRGLSPEALRIYRRQLPQTLKQMGERERTAVMSQLSEFPDLFQLDEETPALPQTQVQKEPLWLKGLQAFGAPFQWIQEKAIEPFAATVTSGYTPTVAGAENLPFFQRELAEYKSWQAPWGVKFAVEMLPWLALPGIGSVAGKGGMVAGRGIAGALGRMGTAGKIAGTALQYSPWGLAEAGAGKVISVGAKAITQPFIKKFAVSTLPDVARFTAPASEVLEKQITKQDWQRQVAQTFGRLPVLKGITEKVGGRAATVTEAVEDTTARALLIHPRVRETLLSKSKVALASLRQINPNPIRLFGIDETTQVAKTVKAKPEFSGVSLHINDIAEHPTKYILTTEQSNYINRVHEIEDWVLDGLKEAKIDVHELKFDEFSHWVHREVVGKDIDEAIIKLHKGGGRIGAKAGWEKTRFYETATEGVKEGILYEPSLERVVELYVQSASKRIADQRLAEAVAVLGEKPLERAWARAPEIMRTAKETAITLGATKQANKIIQRAIRGEKLPEATLKSIENKLPELGVKIRNAIGKPDELKVLVKEAKALEESARAPYWQAKAERTQLMAQAKTPTLGTEAVIMHPAFQGKIYPKDVAGEIQRYWDDMGWTPLNRLATISGEMRTLTATADFSAMFIQGLPSIGRYPGKWAEAAAMSFKTFLNPQYYQNYLVKEMNTLMERANFGGFVGGFEFMEAMPQLQRSAGFITGLLGRKPAVGKEIIRQTYGRFEASFGSFGDVLRNEMWKALKGRAKNEQDLIEISRHIDRMTGVMSSKGLGIGKTQRDFEQAFLFFAPRYTRAGLALVGDLFKGGITGAETRKALGSMMAAGAIGYAGTAMALGQKPDFDPTSAKFMTIEIKDPVTGTTRHFGIGGMMYSLLRFGADVGASVVGAGANEPLDFVKLNRFDNPFIKFMYSKSAPLTGFMEGLLFGHNYFGEPFENPLDYAQFLGQQVIPIAGQQALMEEGGFAPTALLAGEVGARTFPKSDWEKRNIVRDQISQQTYGMSWNELGQRMGQMYQLQLERDNPELQKVTQEAQETSSKMVRGEGKVWDTWRKEGKAVEDRYRQVVTLASQEFERTGNGATFREKVDEASAVRRAMYAQRQSSSEYAEIAAYFTQPLSSQEITNMNPKDFARKQYYQFMFSSDMYDQFGNYKFDEADRREQAFIRQYGQQALDYINEYAGARWQEPGAVKLLRQARDILQPYWDIENQVWNQYGAELKQVSDQIENVARTDERQAKMMMFQYPQIVMARKIIALKRRRMKLFSPEIANALRQFYSY